MQIIFACNSIETYLSHLCNYRKFQMKLITASLYVVYVMAKLEPIKLMTHATVAYADAANHSSTRRNISCKTGETLVTAGLCLDQHYRQMDPPNTSVTKVLFEYVSLEILEIKEDENKIDLNIKIRISWEDYRIKIIPSMIKPIPKFGGLNLSGIYIPEYLSDEMLKGLMGEKTLNAKIWQPNGIRMENVAQEKQIEGYKYFGFVTEKSVMTHFSSNDTPFADPDTTVIIAGKYWKITLPCHFDTDTFPFDTHDCRFGYSNEEARSLMPSISPFQFSLSRNITKNISKFGFTIKPSTEHSTGDIPQAQYVGLRLKLNRILSPFLFQYYLPAVAIVFVSQISFVIPSHSIPGRMGLLATLFLTLVNLFINHMVRSFKDKKNTLLKIPLYFIFCH